MRKNELHISFILTMFAQHADHYDNVLWDDAFMDIIDEFNKNYRTEKNPVTDEEVMEEMVVSKTYEFHRNPTSWWIETKLPDERYSYRIEELKDDTYYMIFDAHNHKHVEAIAFDMPSLTHTNHNGREEELKSEAFWKMMARLRMYNEEYDSYNNEIINYILVA